MQAMAVDFPQVHGHPNRLPGTPGFNNDRDWNGYESLLAKASVTWQLDVTPKLK